MAGEAPAAPIIRDLLKNDELVQLPKLETSDAIAPLINTSKRSDAEQAELAKRAEARQAKQQAAAPAGPSRRRPQRER